MIGTQPEAYVVPYFPSDDFFARIQAQHPADADGRGTD